MRTLARHLHRKTKSLRRGGTDEGDDHQVGIVPRTGWSRRNLEFLRKVLIPAAIKPRKGQQQRPDFTGLPAGKARVFWIGHASFLIQMAGKNILIDPNWALWLSIVKRVRHPGLLAEDMPRIDLVLITHAHHDHLDMPSIEQVADGQPIVVPKGVGSLVKRRGYGEVHEMQKWDRLQLEGIDITFTPCRHWGARYVHDTHRGFGGYMLQAPESPTIYHCGDSAYFDGFYEIGRRFDIDLALMPIGAYRPVSGREVHMNPEEALAAFRDLKARRMVPMHFRTFPLSREPVDEPLERLMLASSAQGLRDKITLLEEGEPGLF